MRYFRHVALLAWVCAACDGTATDGHEVYEDPSAQGRTSGLPLKSCSASEGNERFEIVAVELPEESATERIATVRVQFSGGCGEERFDACWNRRFEDGAARISLGRRHEGSRCGSLVEEDVQLDLSPIDLDLWPRIAGTTQVDLHLEGGRFLRMGPEESEQDFSLAYAVSPPGASSVLDISVRVDPWLPTSESASGTMTFTADPTFNNEYQKLVWTVSEFDDYAMGRVRVRPGSYRLSAQLVRSTDSNVLVGYYPDYCRAKDYDESLDLPRNSEREAELTLYGASGANDPCRSR